MPFDNHKLLASQPRAETDEKAKRRNRLAAQINKQVEFAKIHQPGRIRRGCWYRQHPDGSFTVTIRYGRHDLELAKGKFAIACNTSVDLVNALEEARSLTQAGTFDDQLAKISKNVRAGFEKSRRGQE